MDLFKGIVDPKILRILKLLLDNKSKFFHLTDIAAKANVPAASTFRLMSKLVRLDFIEYEVTGKMKIYRLKDSKKSRKIEEIMRLKI